jgi:uncharacterized membrane protein
MDDVTILQRMRESQVRNWSIPFAYAASAVLLGLTLPRIEVRFLPAWSSGMSSAAAMAMYSSIAAGMITLTGIVFSLEFVMVQFSATAYSPRLVLWMARDPLLLHTIGIFTATFLYAIAALAWVDRRNTTKVPFISGWLVVGLLLASVIVFVRLVQSVSRLQINNVLAFTGQFARQIIDVMYPPLATPYASVNIEFRQLPLTQTLVYSGPPRAIQSLNVAMLVRLAKRADGVLEMRSAVGDTLVESTPLLRVYGGRQTIPERELRNAIQLGQERTFEQDPKYSIHILADIAIRALSPAVNDPTTAVQALDQIEDLLLRLGRRRLEIGEVRDQAGQLRLVMRVPRWEDFLDLAFSQIRSYGASSIQVMRRMQALLSDLIDALPAERHPALQRQRKRLNTTIVRAFPDREDQLEASAEDREGLGAPRRHQVENRSEDVKTTISVDAELN